MRETGGRPKSISTIRTLFGEKMALHQREQQRKAEALEEAARDWKAKQEKDAAEKAAADLEQLRQAN